MKNMFSIKYKLFLTLLLAIGGVVLLSFLMMRWSFDKNFVDYVNEQNKQRLTELSQPLAAYYQEMESWSMLDNEPRLFHQLLRQAMFDLPDEESSPGAMAKPKLRPERKPDFRPGPRPGPHADLRPGFRRPPPKGRPGGNLRANARPEGPGAEHGADFVPPRPPRAGVAAEADPLRYALLDANETVLIGPEKILANLPRSPILNDARVVGYLVMLPVKEVIALNEKFLQQQNDSFAMAGIIVVLIALLVTIPLTLHLLNPITQLTQGTQKLISGDYDIQLSLKTKDELRVLSGHFNTLAETLKRNESSRKRWIADISHELRTPLAILKAEIEAMEDGVIAVTQESLHSLSSEINHLSGLVNDLFELTLSDLGALSYHKAPCILAELMEDTVGHFKSQFNAKSLGLDLEIDHSMQEQSLLLDEKRIKQLLENVIKNSYSYTDCGGKLRVSLSRAGDRALITLRDTKPGVSDTSLTRLFESLYREDSARGRSKGGAGLGLSIVKNIVTAHQGSITASHSSLGGLQIQVSLPV